MEIISGRSKVCKDSQGGISKLWLLPWREYLNEIVVSGNILVEFPQSVIFEFEKTNSSNPTQSMQEDAGGKFYNQSVSLELFGFEYSEIEKFHRKDYRILFLDRNGNFRMLGLYNGLECTTIVKTTGSSKSSFSGYRIDFSGKEESEAVFLDNLDYFEIDPNFFLASSGIFSSTDKKTSEIYI